MEIIDVILYVLLFIMGSVFGSFFSLAVYRLPRKENITYVRSHCTTCNHKLNFGDLIPIWSYLFLGGKCRYCKDKIRSRYILLEIFSGLVFVLIAISLKITAYSTLVEFIKLAFTYLFVCALFIIGGIDKENLVIHDGTLLYGIIVSLSYGLFNAIQGLTMKYNLLGFISISLVLIIVTKVLRYVVPEEKLPIGFGDIKYIALIGLFMGFGMQVLSIVLALVFSAVMALMKKYKQIPFGYFLSISTVIVILLQNNLSQFADLLNVSLM